jgi:hypothetical protein
MKPKILFALLFGVLFSFHVSAQKNINLKFPPISIKDRPFNIIDVVDVRFTDSLHHIGVVHKGMGNKRAYAFVEDSLAKVIQKKLAISLPHLEGKPSIILKINRFGVSEFLLLNWETAFLNFDIDFILKSDSVLYRLNNARVFWEEYGMDATTQHKKQIPLAFETILKNFASKYDSIIETRVKIDDRELYSQKLPKFLTDSVMKIGAYKNFAEFYNNAPSVAHKIYEFKERSYLLVKDEKKTGFRELNPKDTFWGFCDGKNVYINHFGVFYPIVRKENEIGFYGEDITKKRQNYAILGAGVGGAIGGLIGGIIMTSIMDSAKSSNNSKNAKYFQIDWQTGSFMLGEEESTSISGKN